MEQLSTDEINDTIEDDIEIEEDEVSGKVNPLEGYTGENIGSPGKAIRAKCMECSNEQHSLIRGCNVTTCPLYPFRMGKNPYRTAKVMTDEQKAVVRERFAKARKEKSK